MPEIEIGVGTEVGIPLSIPLSISIWPVDTLFQYQSNLPPDPQKFTSEV